MMSPAQQKAWKILTEAEQTALNLSLVHEKSTWEAGEIMGKSHYKYLEINQRATKFFQLFTEYFKNYDRIIPFKCQIAPGFRKYILCLIEKRLDLKDTLNELHQDDWIKPKTRKDAILSGMNHLKNSKFAEDNNLYHLIMDFDRWNNFRILPVSIQEPSAFKRRNKHKLRKLVNLFTSLHPLAVLKIKQLYKVKRSIGIKEYFYLPLYTIHQPELQEVIKISKTEANLKTINNLILYAFRDKSDADRFLEIVVKYISKDYKHCTDGQLFWPEFRILTKKALNYDHILNITPSRKFVLDNAGIDHDFQWFLSAKLKDENERFKLKPVKK